MRKWRPRKLRSFVQGYTVSKWQRQDLDPGSLTLEPVLSPLSPTACHAEEPTVATSGEEVGSGGWTKRVSNFFPSTVIIHCPVEYTHTHTHEFYKDLRIMMEGTNIQTRKLGTVNQPLWQTMRKL